jgi:sec-independent protein translocase protein TatC
MAQIDAIALLRSLHEAQPKLFPAPPADAPTTPIEVKLSVENSERFSTVRVAEEDLHPRTDTPDEAFLIYMKVSIVAGLVLASPWVIYQLWLFVAAGLYPHEQKYVYTYLPASITLFLGGALFAYFAVMPYVLDFLFSFNAWMELRPEIKINSWISFAMTVSLMFGVSFQLPLVMLFLERISIFTATDYREKRRIAILAIAIISMILTPSDPVSMTLMMIPLLLLYELGILLCVKAAKRSPFESQPV